MALQHFVMFVSEKYMKQIGHSRSALETHESDPLRRAASLPSPMRRRICFGSHSHDGYKLERVGENSIDDN